MKCFLKKMAKDVLSRQPRLSRRVNLLWRKYLHKTTGHPKWFDLIKKDPECWSSRLAASYQGKKVLIATSMGGHTGGTTVESLIGASLVLRGVEVHVLLCDRALPACLECQVRWYPNEKTFVKNGPRKDLCVSCFEPARKMYESLGFKVHRYSEYLTDNEKREAADLAKSLSVDEIKSYKIGNVIVGDHALAGALRFFARGTLDGEPNGEAVLQRYFEASLLTAYATERLLKSTVFECAVFHHGIYVPQGVIGEVARENKVRVVNWNPAYRKKCFIFSHHDTYHHTLMTEAQDNWSDMHWTLEMEDEVMKYLKSRWKGSEDWIWFHEAPEFDTAAIKKELGVDFSKPSIGLLTNVVWDAQLHYPANAFPNIIEWVIDTIKYFEKRTDVQLIVRVHPAEIRGTLYSRQQMVDEIQKQFKCIPKNVVIIPPESSVSTYAVMSHCNAVLIYGTKTGVELTSMGIPVIVAGEAWIRGKGITVDANSREHYNVLLEQLPFKQGLGRDTIQRARKYAYHFFFRRMIPLSAMEPSNSNPPFKVSLENMSMLEPGKCRGLDTVCDGIISGSEFVYKTDLELKSNKVGV